MALTIYGSPFSPYVARVVLAASAKGLKFKLELPKDGMKTPEMLKISPFGKVPALIDGGTTLFESSVIIEYLEAKSKAKPLVPKGAKAGAAVRLVAAVAAEYVQPPALKILRHWRSKSTDEAALDAIKADLEKGLNALEKVIAKGKYAAGARFSLADVYAMPALVFLVIFGPHAGLEDPLGKRAKLKAYWKRAQKEKLLKPMLDAVDARLKQMLAS